GQSPVRATERLRFLFRDEAPGHSLVYSARRGCPAHLPFDQLRPRGGRPGHSGRAIERRRRDLVVSGDPRDFFHQVGRTLDVTPPSGDGDEWSVHLETEQL